MWHLLLQVAHSGACKGDSHIEKSPHLRQSAAVPQTPSLVEMLQPTCFMNMCFTMGKTYFSFRQVRFPPCRFWTISKHTNRHQCFNITDADVQCIGRSHKEILWLLYKSCQHHHPSLLLLLWHIHVEMLYTFTYMRPYIQFIFSSFGSHAFSTKQTQMDISSLCNSFLFPPSSTDSLSTSIWT